MNRNARTLKVKADINLPLLPNYVRLVGEPERASGIDVADLDDDTLRTIGLAWTDALVDHAKARRAAKVTA